MQDVEDIEDRPEYLHGCKHGHTVIAGCPRCSHFDDVLVEIVPGKGYVPIITTPEEYASRNEVTRK